MTTVISTGNALIDTLATLFAAMPQVEAVALGGSQRSGMADARSDIDLYVYTREEIPIMMRQFAMEQAGGATIANLGLPFWGPGDEWLDQKTGVEVDSMYFDAAWMEGQLQKAVQRQDRVHVSHLITALLASYFDVIFALNRTNHPGEKRQLAYATQHCPALPEALASNLGAVLDATAPFSNKLIAAVNTLVDRLDLVLEQEGLHTKRWL